MSLARWRAGGWGVAAAAAAGACHTAAFAPLNLGWLQLLAVAAWVWLLDGCSPRQAAWRGWVFSTAWLGSGLWWLYISLHDHGGLPGPLAGLCVLLLAMALSIYLAGAAWAWARWRRGEPLRDALGLAGLWLAAELARAQWFTGFPWIASGYAHSDDLLARLAPWGGVYAMGALSTCLAALLVLPPARGGRAAVACRGLALALVMGLYLLPQDFSQATGRLSVSLLQTNVAQDVKFDPAHIAENMQALQQQLHAAQGQLVVTPESVLPIPRDALPDGFWAQLVAPFRQGPRAALVGTFLGDEQQGYVNSLVGVQPGATAEYAYGKRHLLPFGEFVPTGFRWLVDLMAIPLGDQAAGTVTDPFVVQGQRIRPLNCYEALFGEDMADSLVGPGSATVLLNVSNLAWFGRQMVQDQDLQFSRLRTLEFQRPMVRATNTGATALIDHQGRVVARLPAWTRQTLDVTVEGRTGDTPYASWLAAAGLWPAWALALVCVWGMTQAGSRPVRPRH